MEFTPVHDSKAEAKKHTEQLFSSLKQEQQERKEHGFTKQDKQQILSKVKPDKITSENIVEALGLSKKEIKQVVEGLYSKYHNYTYPLMEKITAFNNRIKQKNCYTLIAKEQNFQDHFFTPNGIIEDEKGLQELKISSFQEIDIPMEIHKYGDSIKYIDNFKAFKEDVKELKTYFSHMPDEIKSFFPTESYNQLFDEILNASYDSKYDIGGIKNLPDIKDVEEINSNRVYKELKKQMS